MNTDKEIELFKQYQKDWCELYIHFCFHKNETPKQCWDRNIFKQHFTFEKWKKGYTQVSTNISSNFNGKEIEGIPLIDKTIRITYNIFHFVPFNIRYTLDK